ncbi:MAG TPA: helix-turn-helix transcriptional regulator [Thermoanaerobaculia bacterium]
MTRKALLARLLRALSGKSQRVFARLLGVDPSLIGQIERGRVAPAREDLDRIAAGAGITLAQAEELLRLYQVFRRSGDARARGAEEALDGLTQGLRALTETIHRRILQLPLPAAPPSPVDRERAEGLWARMEPLPDASRSALVRVAREFQSWALCERVCAESVAEASRDVRRSAALARLAREIAEHVPGPEGWRDRLRGYATAHTANALRVGGDLKGADAAFTAAKRLWRTGSDPAAVLDRGRLPDLEASLRRGQRRFTEALALLDEAFAIGRSPARVLVKKGITLEIMGEYESCIETLLQAVPLVESQGDRLLMNVLACNLGLAYCQAERFAEAAEMAIEVQDGASARGDEILVLRGLWLQGRVAAGLGQSEQALSLLGQVRREFDARDMDYDVALAMLEEAALLLDEGRTEEVKRLAEESKEVFDSKGVHREALAALRLFRQAVEREEATAELARRALRYLFRARHDQGLRFGV